MSERLFVAISRSNPKAEHATCSSLEPLGILNTDEWTEGKISVLLNLSTEGGGQTNELCRDRRQR